MITQAQLDEINRKRREKRRRELSHQEANTIAGDDIDPVALLLMFNDETETAPEPNHTSYAPSDADVGSSAPASSSYDSSNYGGSSSDTGSGGSDGGGGGGGGGE